MHRVVESITDYIKLNILVAVTLCFVGGGVLAKHWLLNKDLLQPLTIALIVSFGMASLVYRKKHVHLLALPLFFCTGLIHTGYNLHPPDNPAHISNLLDHRAKVTLTGRLSTMPEFDGIRTRFNLIADSVLFHRDQAENSRQISTEGIIRLTIDGELPPSIRPGNHLMVLAKAGQISNYRTPGVFDYKLYLAEKNIFVSGKIKSSYEIIPFMDYNAPWYSTIASAPERWRYRIAQYLEGSFDQNTAGLYQALLIGSRAKISASTLEQFKASGCMHLLAISGIHMSLLGLMAALTITWGLKRSTWLLLKYHVPTVATLVSIIPLIFYALIAGMNTPVFRSLFMSILFLVSIILQRQRSLIFIIAAAALFILLWKPLALFTVSFQLSFSSVLAIGLVYPMLLKKHEQHQPSLDKKIGLYITSALVVSIAATLGTLPFMLYHFQRFSLIGPIMNLFVEPFLCLWALPLGLLAIPFIFILPNVASFLLECGSWGILAADKITKTGSNLHFAELWTIIPSIPEILFYYLFLFLMFTPIVIPHKKKFLAVLAAVILVSFTHGMLYTIPSSSSQVSFLDVGQGSSTMYKHTNGRTILIDGGSKTSTSFDIGERIIAPFLRKKKIWRLDDIIVTHPDSDHANGILYLLSHFKPKRLWINGDTSQSWSYEKIIEKAEKNNVQIIKPQTGQVVQIDGDSRITFIQGADLSQQYLSTNDKSLVVKFDHGKNSFLFPGDISKKIEHHLIQNGSDLGADVLLAPHHGSKGSGSREFINTVNPDTIIISASQSSQMYMDPKHLSVWREEGRKVLTTASEGTINCYSNGRTIDIETFTRANNKK